MKFITIGAVHYNVNNISAFCYHAESSELRIQTVGVGHHEYSTHPDPYKIYYERLCKVTGVIPCEEVKE